MHTSSLCNLYISSRLSLALVLITLLIPCGALAGELNAPPAPNDAGSAMFSIEAIYQRLLNGSAGDKRGGTPGTFKEPAGAPGSTSHTLNDVMGVAPVKDTVDGASPDQVVTGKKFWGLKDGAGWGLLVGQMANNGAMEFTPEAATQTIPQGYHDGNGKVRGDANLVTDNIKAGTTIFGVNGKPQVVDTSTGDATADDLMAGKKAFVAGSQVTGTLQTRTLSNATTTVTAGNYASTTLDAVDSDLVTDNIRAGTTIFGVNGKWPVVDTTSGNATAGEILFLRVAWVNGQSVTGTRLGGVILKAGGTFWGSAQRWYDNNDGTITDVTTGLVWLKNVSVSDRTFTATPTDQIDCFRFCGELQNGSSGLHDGSRLNDWRPPTIREMQSLRTGPEPIGGGNFQGFSATASYTYWTISNDTVEPGKALSINMNTGALVPKLKVSYGGDSIRGFVWPVRSAFINP